MASDWPLSSVGIACEINEFNIEQFFKHRSLQQLYIDRILEKTAQDRLEPTFVNEAVSNALGAYKDLSTLNIR